MNTFSADLLHALDPLQLTHLVFSPTDDNGEFIAYNPRTNTMSVRSNFTQLNHFYVYRIECDEEIIFMGAGDDGMTQHIEHHIPGATIVAYDDSSVTLHFYGNTEHVWFIDGFMPVPSQFPNMPTQAQATQDPVPME